MATEFGVSGRVVFGHPGEEQPVVDLATKQPRIGKDGKPRTAVTFGLAVSIDDFNNICWPKMHAEAASIFGPNVHQHPKFAWKFKRDTDLDSKGQPYSTHEGRAGVITLTISTEAFIPPLYKMGANGVYQQIEPKEVKCGDYVYVSINCVAQKPESPAHSPSLYLNPQAVLLIGYGSEIISKAAVDPKQAFAGFSGQLPPGATMQPTAPVNVGAMPSHTVPAVPAGGYVPAPAQSGAMYAVPPTNPMSGVMPGPTAAPGMPIATAAPVQPAHDFVHAATGQAPMTPPGAPMPGAGGYPMPPGR